jgi:hypothetical protein
MIVTNDNTPAERRAYAAGMMQAVDVIEYWLADHAWWKFWLLPHTIRTSIAGIRDGAKYIDENATEQDAPEEVDRQDD